MGMDDSYWDPNKFEVRVGSAGLVVRAELCKELAAARWKLVYTCPELHEVRAAGAKREDLRLIPARGFDFRG